MPKISVLSASIRPEGLEVTRQSLLAQTFRDFEWIVDINWTGEPDLNTSYNRMLRRANGDLMVSLQDHISIAPDALQRAWDYYVAHPDRFVTFPVSQGEADKWDWRGALPEHQAREMDWECDFGMAPMKALKEIGGFDEHLDSLTWGYDNVNVGVRACMAGYTIWSYPEIRAIGAPHERKTFRDKQRAIWHNMRLEEIRSGLKLPKL
jgi:hypothetical protein